MSYVPPSGSTAKTLILVGLILQMIFVLIFFGIGIPLLAFAALFPLLAVIYVAFGVLGIVWLILIWMFSYQPVREGRYEAAKTPTLVFAILSLVTLGIISGILYLIAFIKLGDAIREAQMPPQGYPGAPIAPSMPYAAQPMAPMAPAAPYAAQPMAPMAPAAAPVAPGAVMCPKCGKPATFVPQYNRYYCYTDQQYV